MWETVDSEGRNVVLTDDHWLHILKDHPELRLHRDDILRAVAQPDEDIAGRQPTERWFYREGVGPSRWLKVVVHYEESEGRIYTAFPRRAFP